MSGQFSAQPNTSGSLAFYPVFNSSTLPFDAGRSAFMNEFLIPFPASSGNARPFELKITFRVIAFTDTTVTCESVHTGITQGAETAVIRVERGYDPQPVTTLSRSSSFIPFFVWAKANVVGGVAFTRTISYLRQIC